MVKAGPTELREKILVLFHSSEDVRYMVHCLPSYYEPFHLLYQLKNGLQDFSQIKEVTVVVRSLK